MCTGLSPDYCWWGNKRGSLRAGLFGSDDNDFFLSVLILYPHRIYFQAALPFYALFQGSG